jgi:hypothetical protein
MQVITDWKKAGGAFKPEDTVEFRRSLETEPSGRLGPIPPVDPELTALLEQRKGDRRAATPEPPPTGDGEVVLDAILKKIDEAGMGHAHLFPLQARVRADLVARAEFGLKKYGTRLRTNNGRNAITDLYQEVLDAIMYSMQARMEGKHAGTLVESFLTLAQLIAKELAAQERNEH